MKFIITIFLFLPIIGIAQPNIDSLFGVWEDKSEHDTVRLKAIYSIARKGYLKSNLDSAIICAELQLEFAEKKGYDNFKSYALTTLGNAYHYRRDLDKALSYYQQGLEFNKKMNNKEGIALAYNNIGVFYISNRNYDSTLIYFEKSLTIKKELGDEKKIGKALNNLGYVAKLQGYYKKALKYYNQSLELKKKIKDKKGIAISLNFIGVVYENQGNLAKAIEYYNKSLKTYEETKDLSLEMGVYQRIGALYEEQGDYQKALAHYQKTNEISKKIQNDYFFATSLKNKGDVFAKLNKYDSAFYLINQSKKYFEEINDKKGISTTFESLGMLYELKGDLNKAKKYYYKGLSIDEKSEDKSAIVVSLNNLGNILFEQGEYAKAKVQIKKSLILAQEIGLIVEVREASRLLYKINKKFGDYKQGLLMLELYIKSRDSIDSDENHKEIIRQEYKYEYEKQAAADSVKAQEATKIKNAQLLAEKAENKRYQIEAKQQRQQKFFLYGGLSLALLFGVFIFNRFRVTRKQKEVIEKQKDKVAEAYEELGEKNKEIVDSINYAKRIQSAILPPPKLIKEYLPESFILYKPKDIVAGDFYWLESINHQILLAAADCTGHGVPGAMISVVCNNGLNRSVREYGLSEPAKILDKTREIVIAEFEKSEDEVKDGMDIALISIQKPALSLYENDQAVDENIFTLSYAGAHNPLWIITTYDQYIRLQQEICSKVTENLFSIYRESEWDYVLFEIKADKQPIGKFGTQKPFTNHTIDLQKGDIIYTFSDGYADQFGGDKGKKFKSKNFKKLLLSVQNETMERQRDLIDEVFEEWKRDLEQLDDVCIIGVEL